MTAGLCVDEMGLAVVENGLSGVENAFDGDEKGRGVVDKVAEDLMMVKGVVEEVKWMAGGGGVVVGRRGRSGL